MSHIPLHEGSLSRWQLNIHGHTHANKVMEMFKGQELKTEDRRYFSACVENTNFRPILLDDILKERNLR